VKCRPFPPSGEMFAIGSVVPTLRRKRLGRCLFPIVILLLYFLSFLIGNPLSLPQAERTIKPEGLVCHAAGIALGYNRTASLSINYYFIQIYT
ncbi:hypothetical protein, partial [Enterococcus faecalis]|uniref:hypothetical protein n=1 Tax=Enterococcus faecalis TaxID=1351 RepID=UPI001FD85B98